MELATAMQRAREAGPVDETAWNEGLESLVKLMAPLAPHITEELWARMGKPYSVHQQSWPQFDESLLQVDEVEVVVQVNGKVRSRVTLAVGASEDAAREAALADERVQEHLRGREPKRVIYVEGKLINVVG